MFEIMLLTFSTDACILWLVYLHSKLTINCINIPKLTVISFKSMPVTSSKLQVPKVVLVIFHFSTKLIPHGGVRRAEVKNSALFIVKGTIIVIITHRDRKRAFRVISKEESVRMSKRAGKSSI